MRTTDKLLARLAGAGLVLLLGGVPNTALAMAGQQDGTNPQPVAESPGVSAPPLPDSPSAVLQSAQQSPPPREAQQQGEGQQPQPQPQQRPPWSPEARPAGAAAAEMTNTGGVTASEPAGVAIAPPKQRRLRSVLIKVGAIVGAGVAVGTALALTQASPSTPPGSH